MGKEGKIQLIAVICFIVGSFSISSMLQSGYKAPVKKEEKQRLILVKTQEINISKQVISFDVSGIIEAKNEIDIVPQVSGRVIKIRENFFSGGSFKKGDVLFEIEPDGFEFEVSKKEAELSSAKTSYEIEFAESKAAIMEWNRENKNDKATDLVSRKLQLREAKANLQAAQSQLKNAKLNLKRTKFILPFDGRVVDSVVGIGQHIVAGQAYGQVFDKSVLEVKSSLSDNQLKWLFATKNPKVSFTINYLGKQIIHEGSFKRGAASLDKNTRFASVYFGFNDASKNLIPGIFVDVKVEGPQISDLMNLPLSALQNQNVVWLVENDIISKWLPTIVYIDDEYAVVKGEGMNKVKIVTSRLVGGIEGMKVKTREIKSGENKISENKNLVK